MKAGVGGGGYGLRLEGKTFRMAMSACARNSRFGGAVGQGRVLLGLMEEGMEEPDVDACEMFLGMVRREGGGGLGWKERVGFLGAMDGVVGNLQSLVAYGSWEAEAEAEGERMEGRRGVDEDGDGDGDEDAGKDSWGERAQRKKAKKRELDRRGLGTIPPIDRFKVVKLIRGLVWVYDGLVREAGEAMGAGERRRLMVRKEVLRGWVKRRQDWIEDGDDGGEDVEGDERSGDGDTDGDGDGGGGGGDGWGRYLRSWKKRDGEKR